MADTSFSHPLTGNAEFDGLIADFAELTDPIEIESAHEQMIQTTRPALLKPRSTSRISTLP